MFSPLTIGVMLVFGLAVTSADQIILPEALNRINESIFIGYDNITEFNIAYSDPIAYIHSLSWLVGIGLVAGRGKIAGLDYLFVILVNTATSGISYITIIKDTVQSTFLRIFQPTVQNDVGAVTYLILPFIFILGMFIVGRWFKKRRKKTIQKKKEIEREKFKQEIKEEVKKDIISEMNQAQNPETQIVE